MSTYKILWLASNHHFKVGEHLSISLPEYLFQSEEKICLRIKELGYNAVLFGHSREPIKSQKPWDKSACATLLKRFKQQGIKLILKLQFDAKKCPVHPDYKNCLAQAFEELRKVFPEEEGVFWESSLEDSDYFSHPKAQHALQADLVREELAHLENQLKNQQMLIFFVPCKNPERAQRQSGWLRPLQDGASANSFIAFSAVAGHETEDHRPPHPLWEKSGVLRGMMPIINAGGVNQGGGLWPSLPFDQFDKYFSKLHRFHFGGALILADQIPPGRGFLDCSLWVGGQLQFKENSSERVIEEWFKLYKSEIKFSACRDLFYRLRGLIVDLSALRSSISEKRREEENRLFIDSLMAQLKYLRLKIGQRDLFPGDYFEYFYRDALRMVIHYSKCLNVSPLIQIQEDHQISFWTNPKMEILETPMKGEPGTTMERIFKENRSSYTADCAPNPQ